LHPYLLPGDEVLVEPGQTGNQVCVRFSDGQQETDGWVPRVRVVMEVTPARWSLASWRGHWDGGYPTKQFPWSKSAVDIGVSGLQIHVTGEAVNGGANQDHIGDLDGQAVPEGNRVVIHDGSVSACVVTLTLLGHYLAADDDGGCGPRNGGNFTGLYVIRH
jgi:hypothetical protein